MTVWPDLKRRAKFGRIFDKSVRKLYHIWTKHKNHRVLPGSPPAEEQIVMTYFGFLGIFLVIPILILGALHWLESRLRPTSLVWLISPWIVIGAHVLLALIYTTPWDNYLVATRVWWYDPARVTGITLGWVPIEEYTFFILQPIMTGLWLLWLWRRGWAASSMPVARRWRPWALGALGVLWLSMLILLLSRWEAITYLSLTLSWALLPIMLQVGVGGDILWRHGRLVALGIGAPTLFLAAADALAISSGIWAISPTQSLHWLLFGVLPFEEFVFFLITNILVVFGATLALSPAAHTRLRGWLSQVQVWRNATPGRKQRA